MNFQPLKSLQKYHKALLLTVLAGVILQLGLYHWQIVSYPFPLELREGSMMVTTQLLKHQQNPYALQNQPAATQVYGLLYPFLMLPWVSIFGETLMVYRSIAAIFVFAACYLCFKMIRHAGVSTVLSLFGTATFYAYCLSYASLAKPPNSLGLALFLLSIFLPHRFGFTNAALFGSAIFGILAFASKSYFVLAIAYVALYALLFQSVRIAAKYLAFTAAIAIPLALWVDHQYEYYFYNTVLMHIGLASHDVGHMLNQLADYAKANPGITLIALYAVGRYCTHLATSLKNGKFSRLGDLILEFRNQNLLYCCLSAFIFCTKMGLHLGNYLTYWLELVAPFLIILTLQFVQKNRHQILTVSLIVFNLLVVAHSSVILPPMPSHLQEWPALESLIVQNQNIFTSPQMVPLLIKHNKPVYDNGSTEFFTAPRHLHSRWFKPIIAAAIARNDQFIQDLNHAIATQQFDLIIVTKGESMLVPEAKIAQQYEKIREVTVKMLFHERYQLGIWTRKN